MPTCTCKPKIEIRARDRLHVLDDLQVALVGVDVLDAPVGERMRRAGGEQQAVLFGEPDRLPAQVDDVLARLADRAAHASADLDHRLVHLGLHLLLQLQLSLRDELGVDVRSQIVGLRIDRLVFLLDAEREGGRHGHLQDPARNRSQRYVAAGRGSSAFFTASSATRPTTQSKFACPTECRSASGAGFMKSMA